PTLTLIQRIWVGDSSRPSRFKRIPFTAPGPKPDAEQVRHAYAKGCTEAMTFLKNVIKDLQEGALSAAPPAGVPASDPESLEQETRPPRLPESLAKREQRPSHPPADAAVATGQERVLRLVPHPGEAADRDRTRDLP